MKCAKNIRKANQIETAQVKNENQKKDYLNYLDFSRGIAILLVILGHMVPFSEVKTIIYSLHMPLFFIISGILFENNKKILSKRFLISRIKRLILPYILWSLIWAPFTLSNIIKIFYGTRASLITAQSLSSLWFLICFFYTELIFSLILKLANKIKVYNYFIIGITCLLTVIGFYINISNNFVMNFPKSFDIALIMLPFVMFGYYFGKCLKKYYANITIIKILPLILMAVIVFLIVKNNNVSYVLIADGVFGNVFSFYLKAIFGSILVILFSIIIDKYAFKSFKSVLKFFGVNTIAILGFHKFIIFNLSINVFSVSLLNSILQLLVVLLLLFCIIPVINKLFPLLNGK